MLSCLVLFSIVMFQNVVHAADYPAGQKTVLANNASNDADPNLVDVRSLPAQVGEAAVDRLAEEAVRERWRLLALYVGIGIAPIGCILLAMLIARRPTKQQD